MCLLKFRSNDVCSSRLNVGFYPHWLVYSSRIWRFVSKIHFRASWCWKSIKSTRLLRDLSFILFVTHRFMLSWNAYYLFILHTVFFFLLLLHFLLPSVQWANQLKFTSHYSYRLDWSLRTICNTQTVKYQVLICTDNSKACLNLWRPFHYHHIYHAAKRPTFGTYFIKFFEHF